MSAERRQYRRIPMGATVAFQEISFQKAPEPAESRYLDVSAGGLLIASPKAYPLGTLLKLEVRVPGWGRHQGRFGSPQDLDQRPLVAIGEVVRLEQLEAGEYEIGIKFQNVYPDDQSALVKFIEASASPDEL